MKKQENEARFSPGDIATVTSDRWITVWDAGEKNEQFISAGKHIFVVQVVVKSQPNVIRFEDHSGNLIFRGRKGTKEKARTNSTVEYVRILVDGSMMMTKAKNLCHLSKAQREAVKSAEAK